MTTTMSDHATLSFLFLSKSADE